MMILNFFKNLFGVQPQTTTFEQQQNFIYDIKYKDITDFNLISVLANKLTNLALSDSRITIASDDENPRSVYLNSVFMKLVENLDRITSRALGFGSVVVKPCIDGDNIYFDIIPQSNFVVVESSGDKLIKAGFVAETIVLGNYDRISRIEYHILNPDGTYTIEQKALKNDQEVPLNTYPAWANLPPAQTITGVTRMLFTILKCPMDNKRTSVDFYGVPITFGQDKLLGEINAVLNKLQREIEIKDSFIGADYKLFMDGNLPESGVFKFFKSDNQDFFQIFDPNIREQNYINVLDFKLSQLETAVGVNRGVLTRMETQHATATQIKRSTQDTFALVDKLRANIEKSLNDLAYACDVLANANNITPPGDWVLNIHWSYALLEDSTETWAQLIQGQAVGAVSLVELREFIFDEDRETAEENLPNDIPVSVNLPPAESAGA